MPLPRLDQPMAAQVVAVAMVADGWRRRGQDAAHGGVVDPAAARHGWEGEAQLRVITLVTTLRPRAS